MKKLFFISFLVFVLVSTTFCFGQVKLTPEQRKSNQHEMIMRTIRNKDHERSLEIAYVSLDGDSISKFKRQIYHGHFKKVKSVTGTDSKFDTIGPKLIGPVNENIELTEEELRDQKTRDSLSGLKSFLSLKEAEESMMIQKKDLQPIKKHNVDKVFFKNDKYLYLKIFIITLVVCFVLIMINQWSYILERYFFTKKIPPLKKKE